MKSYSRLLIIAAALLLLAYVRHWAFRASELMTPTSEFCNNKSTVVIHECFNL